MTPSSETRSRTNAAKRLYSALQSLKQVDGTYQQGGTVFTRSALQVLPMGLHLRPDPQMDSASWELMRSLKLITEMMTDLRREVELQSFDAEDTAFYLRDLPKLANLFSPKNLVTSWNEISRHISAEMLANVENLDRVLNRRVSEQGILEEELKLLVKQVDAVLADLETLAIEAELRALLEGQLRGVKLAVDVYQYRGIRALQPAIAGVVGAVALAHNDLEAASSSERDASKVQRLLDLCKKGAEILNAARGTAWVWPHLTQGAHVIVSILARIGS